MYLPPLTTGPRWRTLGLALAAAVLAAGCGDGEPRSEITVPEPSQSHLGDNFHWDLIAGPTNDVEVVNGATWQFPVPFNVGTGRINPFLRVQKSPRELGLNSDGNHALDEKQGTFTHSLLLSAIPTILNGGVETKELILDANESNSDAIAAQFAINEFNLYECLDNPAAATYTQEAQAAANCDLIYEVNPDGQSRAQATDAATSGSGNALDYRILLPASIFADDEECGYAPDNGTDCDTYIILYVDFGDDTDEEWATNATFEELSTIRRPQVTVSKTAEVSATRTYTWMVEKVGDITSHALLPGQTGTTEYTISVDTIGSEVTEATMTGEITVSNASGETAQVDFIVDSLPDNTELSPGSGLTCTEGGSPVGAGDFPYMLADGDAIVCTFSTSSVAGVGDTNRAFAGISDPEDLATELPVAHGEYTLMAADVNETIVHETVDVYDEYTGSDDPDASPVFLGTASISDVLPKEFTRSRDWTYGGTVCELGSVVNYGTITEAGTSNVLDTDDETVTIQCAEIAVSKTAATSLTRTWNWTIDKTVTPDAWALFDGDDGTSDWQVSVDKVDFDDSDWNVSGVITVANTGDFAVTITSVTDEVNGSIAATVDNCSIALPAALAAGASMTCDYSADLPDGSAGSNVASATIDGDGTIDSDPVDFDFAPADVVNEVYDEVNVTDSNGMSWGPVSDDTTFPSYPETFACPADEGTHDNTATITETGDSDDASVTVACYDLSVLKDANTSLTRTWTWEILKELDTSVFAEGTYDEVNNIASIQDGQSLIVQWNITLDASSVDSDWAADGDITIHNNHPSMAATINGVTDVVSPAIAATVDCGVTFPYSLAAGADLQCSYDVDLPDATTRTNTATATQQNHSYASDGTPTPSGTTDYSDDETVDFSGATVSEIDECVDVSDILEQEGVEVGSEDLGSYCASEGLPKQYTVDFEFGGAEGIPLTCDENIFDNTASFVTNDTGTDGESTSSTTIFVACEIGCTLTQGYWKTHNVEFWGGAPADERWYDIDPDGDLSNEGPDEDFYLSGDTWFEVFWTAPKGNVYYNLAHQYMAAYLNHHAGGASAPPEVMDALADAQAMFETYTPAQMKSWKGNDAMRQQAIELAGILGSYNEGEIGPGHCTENVEPEA